MGVGAISVLYFAALLAGASSVPVFIGLETAALLAVAVLALRRTMFAPEVPPDHPPCSWNGVLAGAMAILVLLLAWGLFDSYETNPFGEWDAWSIWNLRAKMLASDSWRNALSPLLDASHPDYPLLLSGFIGRVWRLSGGAAPFVPAATSALFLFATLCLTVSALAAARRASLGWMAALVLGGTTGYVLQGPVQYADLPLAFYFLSTAALLCLADRFPDHSAPLLAGAGLSASLAAWTKNEGWVFFGIAILLWFVLRRRGWIPLLAGALPVTTLALAFRLSIAPPADPFIKQGLGGALAHFGVASRYQQVAGSFFTEILNLGTPFTHPLLILAVLAFALRFDWPGRRTTSTLLIAITAAMLISYAAIFLATPSDLVWHLGTAAGRLIVQLWPLAVFTILFALRDPESYVPAPASSMKQQRTPPPAHS